jgi:hypothetical protein
MCKNWVISLYVGKEKELETKKKKKNVFSVI